ncbi:hypothetical protein DPMN_170649 [Dreissena polymorpha]|uniref:Uncharacterized protein n=1 Tax=Dreissena polymorpha TaxID=45954 RepID=A0A9D4E066_DREPO|nr:hypothetical protein DPMN_170649 [Dreissena polymorpha]
MLYVLILAFVLTCVSCGERNALGLSARTNEDSVPLNPSRSLTLTAGIAAIFGGVAFFHQSSGDLRRQMGGLVEKGKH